MFEKIKEYVKLEWPTWRAWLYRWVRGAFSTALGETLFMACSQTLQNANLVQCFLTVKERWTDPKQAAVALSVALVSGFFLALGKALRDKFGATTRGDAPSMFEKIFPL